MEESNDTIITENTNTNACNEIKEVIRMVYSSNSINAGTDDNQINLKHKAMAMMLSIKHKRTDDINIKEDEKEIKKKAVDEESNLNSNINEVHNENNTDNINEIHNNEKGGNEAMDVEKENKNEIEIDDSNKPQFNEALQITPIVNLTEISDVPDVPDKADKEPYTNTNVINTSNIILPTIIIPTSSNPNTDPIENKELVSSLISAAPTNDTAAVTNVSNVNVGKAPKEEIHVKPASKKISFTEAKKEIEEFSNQIERIENEMKEKYGLNLTEFYYEDLLPEELKMKLIEEYFNSEEIIELSKRTANI